MAGHKKIDKKKVKFLDWAKKKLGEDYDKTDIEAQYDNKLTLAENKTQFAKFLKARLEAKNDEYEAYIDDWFEKAKKELKKRPVITEIKQFYKPIYDTIGRLKLKSNQINLIFCKGRGGIGKCLDKNSLVTTPKGLIRLKNLREGNIVLGYNFKTNRIENAIVKTKFHRKYDEIVIINDMIRTSPEHHFFTQRGWIRAKDLKNNDILHLYGDDTYFRKGLVLSRRNNRWRRQYNANSTKEKEQPHNPSTDNLYQQFGNGTHGLVESTFQTEKSEINEGLEIHQFNETSQNNISSINNRHREHRNYSQKDISDFEMQEKTSRNFNEVQRIAKIQSRNRKEIPISKNIFKGRNKTFLGIKTGEFIPITISKIYKEIEKKSELQDISTTLGNYIANGILVHNSWHIRNALNENKIEYEEYQTVTEATLPEILYRNEDKTLWFKDVVKIFNNPNAIDIIKSATETDCVDGGRLISVNKYSHELKKAGIPRKFIFKGNIVFDYNYLEHTNYQEDFEALKSRGYCVDLVFDYEKMCQIMKLIAQNEHESKVTGFLIKNYRFVGHNAFNLRTQAKAINTYRCAVEQKIDWEQALLEELKNVRSRTQEWLYQFVGEGIIKRKDLVKLIMRTGLLNTEATAYRRIRNWEYGDEIFEVAHGVYALTPDKIQIPKVVQNTNIKVKDNNNEGEKDVIKVVAQ